MFRIMMLMLALSIITGCAVRHTQDTSGQSYLSSFQADPYKPKKLKGIDEDLTINQEVIRAASIEPILKFPARIGLAKFENGKLVDISPRDWSDWNVLTEKHQKLGDFVALNVLGTGGVNNGYVRFRGGRYNIEALRVAAAKQHLDALLIYEVDASSRDYRNALSVVDLTLVGGAVLPTRTINVESHARALLIDVRNGYPYGVASSEETFKKYGTSFNAREQSVLAKDEALFQSYEKLFPQIEEVFEELLDKQSS